MKIKDIKYNEILVPIRKHQFNEWGYCVFIRNDQRGIILIADKRGNHHFINASKIRRANETEIETLNIESNDKLMKNLDLVKQIPKKELDI